MLRKTFRTGSRAFRQEPWQAEKLTDIGTRSIFNEDHDMFRESVRKWFQDTVPRDLEEKWEKQGMCDREAWLKAGEMGLLGVDAPEEVGGIGGDFLSAMIVNEEQAYHNCSGLGFSVHSDICLPYIYKYGTAEQRELIPSFVSGEKILCIAMTEPGTGSDLQGLKTTAVADGDDFVINGSKVFISNGIMADYCILAVVTDPSATNKAAAMSLFLVDTSLPGTLKMKKFGIFDKFLTPQNKSQFFQA